MATTTPNTGWPDATNTGVPAGVTLTPSGDLVITQAGTIISGLDIHGTIYIAAPNVTIENCKVTSASFAVIQIKAGTTGVVVQNCEINGLGSVSGSTGIQGEGTFIGNNIYNVENGIDLSGSSVIQDNYIHNLLAAGSPHYDGIQIDGDVSNVIISHNTVINQNDSVSAIMIDNGFGPISNIRVDNNLLAGGGFTVYTDAQFNGGSISGVSFTNNHMVSGQYGITDFNLTNPTYTGNVNDGATLITTLNTSANTGSGTGGSTPPSAPVIASFSSDSGVVGDHITNDNTLTLTGTAAANSTVKVFDGTTQIGTATAGSSGAWSYTTAALADGTHNLTAKAADSSGMTSAASSALALKIDTTAPNAPTVAAPSNNASGGVNLTGTAEANSTVKVFDGATQIGTATANSSGAWSLATGALTTGNHSLTAKATDAAGNTGVASAAVVANIPSPTPSAPAAPQIASFSNDTGVAGDGITSDNTLTLTGTAAANSTVKVFDGGTQIGTTTAKSDGSWDYITSVLNDAKHMLTVKATDGSGQTSAASSVLTVTVDTVAPNAPVEASDSIVNGNQVQLTGTAEANSTLKVYDGTTLVGTTTTNATGNWTVTTSPLLIGAHALKATATDAAGNTSAVSSPLNPVIEPKVIESFGSTRLVQVGSNYFLNSISGGTGPELKFGGAAVVAGQFGNIAPIGVEQTGSGYNVAWKVPGADQYIVWSTDSSGNYLATISGPSAVLGTSTMLKSLETTFHQDLNGDGTMGVPSSGPTTTVIESFGSTSLAQAGNNFYLNSISSGTGPELKFGGAAVVAGQFGTIAPIGVEQTGSGYDVTWKVPGADQYIVWSTDSSGNYLSTISGPSAVSGTSTTLESLETTFHQDLNGDGGIGVPSGGPATTVIEAFGSTSPVQVGNNYFLNSISSGSGPELKFGGAAVVAGQFGNIAPIGAEQTSNGYDVAWKVPGADQYIVWSTDSSGNYLSTISGPSAVSGTSTTLESLESTFHQDLNGDGTIGVPTTNAPASAVELTDVSKSSLGIVTLKGTADASSHIQILDGSNVVGTVTSANDGTWSFASSSAVSNTVHTYKAQELDSTGHVGASSGSAILGSTGGDTLTSTAGNDLLVGNRGHDTFVFAPNFGNDVINDFGAGSRSHDVIQFSMSVFDSFASVLAHATQVGQDVVIAADATDSLTLKNVKLAALDKTDFHFA